MKFDEKKMILHARTHNKRKYKTCVVFAVAIFTRLNTIFLIIKLFPRRV